MLICIFPPLEHLSHLSDGICLYVRCKNSLKILKGLSESVSQRRTDNTMVKRKRTKRQTTIYKTYT